MKSTAESKLKKELKNKVVLITGGGGSIGFALAKRILRYPVQSVRILDINEHSLFTMKRNLNNSRLRMLLGSVLDKERVEMACSNADIIIHAAALKNIEITEFNPIETIDANVNGTVNFIKTVMRNKPEKFLNISTDKVVNASTLYGMTKQLGEKITSWAGLHVKPTKFASVRLGNIIESSGNVFEIWKAEKKNNKPLSITNPKMKRYFFHIDEAISFILRSMLLMDRGEIFVPKMKEYKVTELAKNFSRKHKIIGIRQGEKINEQLLTDLEKEHSTEKADMWIIKPYY